MLLLFLSSLLCQKEFIYALRAYNFVWREFRFRNDIGFGMACIWVEWKCLYVKFVCKSRKVLHIELHLGF